MIGAARLGHFKTKIDYYNLLKREPETAKARLEELKAGRFVWFAVGILTEGEAGQEDETHKVIETDGEMGEEPGRVQYALLEDPNAEFFRLGFTLEEAEIFMATEVEAEAEEVEDENG